MATSRWTITRSFMGLTLSLFLFSKGLYAKVIWERADLKDFSFSGIRSVSFFDNFSNEQEKQFISIIEEAIGKDGTLKVIDLGQKKSNLDEFAADVFFTAMLEKMDDDLHLLTLSARLPSVAKLNQASFNAVVWEMVYLFKGKDEFKNDLVKNLRVAMNGYVERFFKTNPTSKGSGVFYISTFLEKEKKNLVQKTT